MKTVCRSYLLPLVLIMGVLLSASGVFAADAKGTPSGPTIADKEHLILGFRGKSKYQIVVPDELPNGTVRDSVERSAALLQEAFAANGIALEIEEESAADLSRPGVFLGATSFAAANGVERADLKGWMYAHKAVGRHIIIAGNDEPDILAGKRGFKRKVDLPFQGTLFGTAEFVYRYVGARFLSPNAAGTAFVPKSIIYLPRALDVVGQPYFSEHDVRDSTSLFAVANHCRKFNRVWSRYGHQHPVAVPISEYGESHPEYFILTGNVRQPEVSMKNGQLCLSNPEVRELIYQHLLDRCDDGFEVVELGQADGYQPCQCQECAALYGIQPTTRPDQGIAYIRDRAWGEKLWIMHRDMAQRLLVDRPGKKVMITSYGPTLRPPQTFTDFPENTIIEMMHTDAGAFDEWKGVNVPGGYSAYLYNWGNFHLVGLTPLTTIGRIAEQNRLLRENQVTMVQVNGSPMSGQWGIEGPNIYAYVRLGVDPTYKTAEELFDEYLEAAFRESENQMRRFFTNIQKRAELWAVLRPYAYESGRDPIFALGTLYPPGVINSLDETLTMAEKTAVLPEVKQRLDIVRYEFDFLKHLALVINSYRNHEAIQSGQSLNQLLDAIDARNEFVSSVANGDEKYPKGKNPAYRYMGERAVKYAGRYLERAPFNWDTAKLRANPGSLIQQARQSLEITRAAKAPTLDSPEWDGVKSHSLAPAAAAGGKLKAQTSFRILYDGENLYIRVSGEQPAGQMEFVSRGRDAELWLQESIIVNISPFADRSRYFYFAYEPDAASYNDAEHGFITDYLHPRYGWNDESWNGNWRFETQLLPAKNRWESMAVIPFKTLRVSPPEKGELWYLNVGRVHFPEGAAASDKRELSAWTGTLNPSHIPGDASFGQATFK